MIVKKSRKEKEKAVTVVGVDGSVPRDKRKLKSSEQMKLCLISPSDSKDIIISKLKHLFQREVKVV